jgi:hypothetical protein
MKCNDIHLVESHDTASIAVMSDSRTSWQVRVETAMLRSAVHDLSYAVSTLRSEHSAQ